MSKEKIVKLISSPTADQNTMAIKLAKWIEKDPSLLNLTFVRDKSILHLLVSANKPQVLNKLLQHPVWCAKALVGDKSGCTILHYAARHPEDLAMLLEILLQYVPTLLNIPNKKGNTPLHAAVLANQLWAVKALVKNKSIDRSLKNLEGKTAMSLAGMNNALKQALLHLELPAKQSPDLRLQPYSQSPDASLRKVFPFLSSGSESNDAISALSTLGSSHSFTTYATSSSGSYIASEAEEENEQEDSIYLAKMSRQLQELITSYKVEGHSPTYSLLQAQFNSSCELYALSDDFELKEITSDIAAAQAVISQTLDVLHPLVTESHKQIQHKMQSLLQMFTYLLAHNNLMADAEPRGALPTKPRPKADPLKEMPLDEILWLLTACQECINSKREFDESRLKNRVLSLLCAHQFVEILICLRMLYPALDHDQKTIANLIIVHLLFQHANDRIKLSPVINTHLRFIYKLNADKLGTLGEQINELLQQALEFASLLNKQPLLRNFYLLNQEISKIDHTKHNSSFDALVEQALSLSRTNRTQHVLLIAHELHMLTLSFYQHVSIHEFNKNNWLEQNRDERSPQIVAFTHCFNKLSAYFIKKYWLNPQIRSKMRCNLCLNYFRFSALFSAKKTMICTV
ncbi:ankyrin repeat domain-containing protein [Legionella drancourtii]|uniref:Uncharacterized protein n=1 Tax=Legionella drancourtii LLAP12 TaxID=658187 RepID=G9EJL4_9GAMM|nr:ankyrin repeat domain-containing protein [Legionella drancourtii]EHL32424.1 hypothetical protein LDG_5380 [Legionella drancourtii LLAP12]